MGGDPASKGGQIMQKFGERVRKLMTKFWIWVVTITLFAIGIAGDEMTLFRIIYTALALIFVITFQVNFFFFRNKYIRVFYLESLYYDDRKPNSVWIRLTVSTPCPLTVFEWCLISHRNLNCFNLDKLLFSPVFSVSVAKIPFKGYWLKLISSAYSQAFKTGDI